MNTMMGLIDERNTLIRLRDDLAKELVEVDSKIEAKTAELTAYLADTNAVLIHHDGRSSRAYFAMYGELHCHPATYSHEAHRRPEPEAATVEFDFRAPSTKGVANGHQA